MGVICKNHTMLSDKQREILQGLLLSDGCVRTDANNKTAKLSLTTVEEELATHLMEILPYQFNKSVMPEEERIICGRICHAKQTYRVVSRVDLSLNKYEGEWYKNRIKIVPVDIKLTPTICRYWFYGDGYSSYLKYKGQNRYVVIGLCTNSFTLQECKLLIEKIEQASGVVFHIINDHGTPSLQLTKNPSIGKFLNYIGKCELECYDYKWKYPLITRNYTLKGAN